MLLHRAQGLHQRIAPVAVQAQGACDGCGRGGVHGVVQAR